MDGGIILLLLIGVGILIYFNSTSKEALQEQIRGLKTQLENPELKKAQFEAFKEIQQKKKDAESEARIIRAKAREYAVNYQKKINKELADKIEQFEVEKKRLIMRNEYLEGLYSSFQQSYILGRKWLINLILNVQKEKDDYNIALLLEKKQPAIKAAEKLSEIQKERRDLLAKYKFLEYQLKTYEEYFPFLLDYQNEILNDEIFEKKHIENNNYDPASRYLSPEEFASLTTTQKNQLALDRYLQKDLSKSEIGKMYERYLGYFYEQQGFNVQFTGIEKGFEDLGQDLICTKENQVVIIQAKCWSKEKEIREKHILQLFSTTLLHQIENPNKNTEYSSILYTTTTLSQLAKNIAKKLNVNYVENFSLDKKYPMIKCNIGKNNEKIYHLPFDQMYDKVKISEKGELYVKTVSEAEKRGFRRAFRFQIK